MKGRGIHSDVDESAGGRAYRRHHAEVHTMPGLLQYAASAWDAAQTVTAAEGGLHEAGDGDVAGDGE